MSLLSLYPDIEIYFKRLPEELQRSFSNDDEPDYSLAHVLDFSHLTCKCPEWLYRCENLKMLNLVDARISDLALELLPTNCIVIERALSPSQIEFDIVRVE